MKIPYFLTLFLIFLGWAALKRYQATKKDKERQDAFWKKEEEANATRRQDISNLPYIKIPTENLPFGIGSDAKIRDAEALLQELASLEILNLTGISNTDLKLMYGAANLPFLTECDDRFAAMCQALHTWGELLLDEGCINEARTVFEYAISAGSDISKTYLLLADIYKQLDKPHLISNLIPQAEQLNSLSKDTIILKLSEFVHK